MSCLAKYLTGYGLLFLTTCATGLFWNKINSIARIFLWVVTFGLVTWLWWGLMESALSLCFFAVFACLLSWRVFMALIRYDIRKEFEKYHRG